MQSYVEIGAGETLANSLAEILNNDKTVMSCHSGAAFPTANLQVGMLCFRTDLNKLFQLKDATPTWVLLLNLSTASANAAAYEGMHGFLIRNPGSPNEGGEIHIQKPVSGSTLTGDLVIDLLGDKLRIFDLSGTNKGFYVDLSLAGAGVTTKLWHDANGATSTAEITHAATSKATPVDADEIPLIDSAATFALKKLTWANLKATLLTYFNGMYVAFTAATGSAKLPAGTTAQRDGTPSAGWFRFNSDYAKPEIFTGAAWAGLGGASGAGGDAVFYENGTTVNSSYTITAGTNAMSAGPITIATGATVTIPTGSTWSIV